MKIKHIQISNFKAFYGKYDIPINGKNLLVYGENGSGKSSLYSAIQDFFLSSIKGIEDLPFSENEWNKRNPTNVEKQIVITFDTKDEPYYYNVLNPVSATENFIKEIGEQKPFLTYSRLLNTYLTEKGNIEKRIFKLLIEDIVGNYTDTNGYKLIDTWTDFIELGEKYSKLNRHDREIQDYLATFNNEFKLIVESLVDKTNEYLEKYFKTEIKFKIEIPQFTSNATSSPELRKEVWEQVESAKANIEIQLFNNKIEQDYHHFFNEARLSALAISMYLASFKVIPEPDDFKIIFLDDVFIGLDNGNRIPLLDIIKSNDFKDYQIFITTYDRYWFEIAKRHLPNKQWEKIEMYVSKGNANGAVFEKPKVMLSSDNYYQKAVKYRDVKDYPACANYLRKELEKLIKERLPEELTRTEDKPHDLNYLWTLCVERYNGLNITVNSEIKENFKTSRLMLLNPLSHDTLEAPVYENEIQRAFDLITEIQSLPIIEKIVLLSEGMKLKFTHPILNYTFEFKLNQDFYIDKNGTAQSVKLPKCKIITWQYNNNEFWNTAENKPINNYQKILDTESKLEKIIENHVKIPVLELTEEKFLKNTWYSNIWSLKEIYDKAGVVY